MSSPTYEPPREEAQARLAAIIESSDDAIVSKTLDGFIQTWNKGAERIFGWMAEEVIGKPIAILIPADRLQEEPGILARLRRGERVDHFETIRQTKDGRRINVSVTISPIRDLSGRIIGASKIARDITLQKQFQGQILAARDAAEDSRRMAELAKHEAECARAEAENANRAKDHFLSVLSHELRTPLTPILGAMSLLERDAALPGPVLELVSMIRRNVETEARLVDDLLDLTRIARGNIQLQLEIVDAHAALRSLVAMLTSQIEEKRLTLALSLHAKRSSIRADAGRFQQILLNLLSNAIKFTPEGGTITLRTSNENGTLKIEVVDDGVGIEPGALPRLFNAFEQGEQTITRRFGGLGLGLSIVKSLVEMHKASVSAFSEGTNKGATFTLRFAEVSPDSRLVLPAAPARPSRSAKARILLVEDHEDTRRVLVKLLESLGCTVTSATSVKEAIAAAERQKFDLLLSDIGLPDGSGLDVMRELSARFDIKGIALSGFGQDVDLRRSTEAGFTTHLTKPISLQVLEEVILRVTAGQSP